MSSRSFGSRKTNSSSIGMTLPTSSMSLRSSSSVMVREPIATSQRNSLSVSRVRKLPTPPPGIVPTRAIRRGRRRPRSFPGSTSGTPSQAICGAISVKKVLRNAGSSVIVPRPFKRAESAGRAFTKAARAEAAA